MRRLKGLTPKLEGKLIDFLSYLKLFALCEMKTAIGLYTPII